MAKATKPRKAFSLKKPRDKKPVVESKWYSHSTPESVELLVRINEKFRDKKCLLRFNSYGDINECILKGRLYVEYLRENITQVEQAVVRMEKFTKRRDKNK